MARFKIFDTADKEAVKEYIDKLPLDKKFEIDIKLRRERRTIPQNSLLHLWFKCIEDETGQDSESVKLLCKEMFLGYSEINIFGRVAYELISTAALNTLQMNEFMAKIQAWAASELGIILPIPDDLIFTQFYDNYRDK